MKLTCQFLFLILPFFSQVAAAGTTEIVNCIQTAKAQGLSTEETVELCPYAPNAFPLQCYLLAQQVPYEISKAAARVLCKGASNRGPLNCFLQVRRALPDTAESDLAGLCNWAND